MKKSILEKLTKQINMELFSAYLYLEFNNYLVEKGMPGFGNWFRVQAQEEMSHAMLIYEYLQYNSQPIELEAVDKPVAKLDSVMDVLKGALEHEQLVTASIYDIYEEALKERDYRTKEFLDWFVKEQGEEEANAQDLIDRMALLGGEKGPGVYILDKELATRVYAPPSLVVGE